MSAAPQDSPLKAALWMFFATFWFCTMGVSGRELSSDLNTFEIMTFRSVIALIAVSIFATATRRWAEVSTRRLDLHLGRNICHFSGQNLWLFAMGLIPLAQVFAFEFFYPILVGIGAALFLGERFTRLRVLTAMLGFGGILIVAGLIRWDGAALHLNWPENVSKIGLIAAMACAFGFAGSALFTKSLTRQTQMSVLNIMFWMSLLQLFMGLIFLLFQKTVSVPSLEALFWIAMLALGGLGAHSSLTSALKIAPASIVTPIDFLRLPAIAIVAWWLYDESLEANILVGALVIFFANYANILHESKLAKKKAHQTH